MRPEELEVDPEDRARAEPGTATFDCRLMDANSRETEALIQSAREGGSEELGRLLVRYAGRLRSMVSLRLDRRLVGRVDASDVLQEAFLDATRSFRRYRERPSRSFYVWLRCIAARQLIDIHRHHLGVKARDPRREVSLDRPFLPEATSAAIAAHLLGHLTSPSEAAARSEGVARLEASLEKMDRLDREVLALRHFEQLTNLETAEVLGIEESAASKRHLRALRRLKDLLKEL
jgi:RNA polymerase sigma-70 factor, ECF subfamily